MRRQDEEDDVWTSAELWTLGSGGFCREGIDLVV